MSPAVSIPVLPPNDVCDDVEKEETLASDEKNVEVGVKERTEADRQNLQIIYYQNDDIEEDVKKEDEVYERR